MTLGLGSVIDIIKIVITIPSLKFPSHYRIVATNT